MKSKLLNNKEYQISSYVKNDDDTLDILFINNTCEELSIIFSDKPTLSKIRFMSDTNEVIEIINDYVVEKWVKLVDGIKTVKLTKEASDTEARITQAEAKVLESNLAVEELKATTTATLAVSDASVAEMLLQMTITNETIDYILCDVLPSLNIEV